jgi:hypothetical protein
VREDEIGVRPVRPEREPLLELTLALRAQSLDGPRVDGD